jgi:hypothetical protein
MKADTIIQSSKAYFVMCPEKFRKQIIKGIQSLEIKEIKIERELTALPGTTGGPLDHHVPTGRITYTIEGYKRRGQGKKKKS